MIEMQQEVNDLHADLEKGKSNLRCRSPLSWEESSNEYSKWCESLYCNIHWNINSLQACQCKCHISIIE